VERDERQYDNCRSVAPLSAAATTGLYDTANSLQSVSTIALVADISCQATRSSCCSRSRLAELIRTRLSDFDRFAQSIVEYLDKGDQPD
jgi:hypothetical protein